MCYPEAIAVANMAGQIEAQNIQADLAEQQGGALVQNLTIGYNQAVERARQIQTQADAELMGRTRQKLREEARLQVMHTAAGLTGGTADRALSNAEIRADLDKDVVVTNKDNQLFNVQEDIDNMYTQTKQNLDNLRNASKQNFLVNTVNVLTAGAQGYLTGKDFKDTLNIK